MSESRHTPGPWKVVSRVEFGNGLTYTSVQPVNADPATMRPLLMVGGEHHICRMTHTAAQHAIALHRANASLIAAAPELLGELRRMVEHFEAFANDHSMEASTETWAALHCAKAAISKAESPTP